jgi:hypothetical protein
VSGSMKVRWPKTVLKDTEEIYIWIERNLFPEDFLRLSVFGAWQELYRCSFPTDLLELVVFGRPQPASFSKADLNDAIMGACRTCGYDTSAYWWSVNVHDNIVRVVERVGIYDFANPLEPLLLQIAANPAAQGGHCYAGLLDSGRRWSLTIEESGDEFAISVQGPPEFCRQVATSVGVSGSA